MSAGLYVPRYLDLDKWKKSLWALERKDGRGLCVWEEHSQKPEMKAGTPTAPVTCMLMWTTSDAAEEYNEKALKNTGRLYAIPKATVMSHLYGLRASGIEWVFLNKPPIDIEETRRTGISKTRDLIEFLQRGGRIGDGKL